MWEKAVHADLLHRWIKNNLGLPVFVCNRVVVFDGYAAKRLVIRCQAVSKHAIVRTIRDSQQAHPSQERSQSDSPEPWPGFVAGFVAFDRGHPLNYTRPRTDPGTAALTILHKNLGLSCSPARQKGIEIDDKIQQKATNESFCPSSI